MIMSSYHKNKIMNHSHQSVLKIKEEVEELIDSIASDNKLMAGMELSDIYLNLKQIANRYGFTMEDLSIMADTTLSVFNSKGRQSKSLYEIVSSNTQYVLADRVDGLTPLLCFDDSYCYYFTTHESDELRNDLLDIEYFEILCGEATIDGVKLKPNTLYRNIMSRMTINHGCVVLLKSKGHFNKYKFIRIRDDKMNMQLINLKNMLESINV